MTSLADKLAVERARPARYGPGYGVPAGAYAALLDVAQAALKYECHGSIDEADCPDAQLNAALARLDEALA
jgi:hypothetical protein